MDVKKIKYNVELEKRKTELTRNLKWLEEEQQKQQETCSHLPVFFNREGINVKPGEFYVERCLFCGKQEIEDSTPKINASTYLRRYKRTFGEEATIESAIQFLQTFCIELLNDNPNLTEEELKEKLEQEIERDNEENKKEKSFVKKLYNLS